MRRKDERGENIQKKKKGWKRGVCASLCAGGKCDAFLRFCDAE